MKCKRRFMHGKRRKRSPLHQDATAYTTDPTVKKKSDRYATSKSDHPRVKGGSIAVGAPAAISKVYKGIKSILSK